MALCAGEAVFAPGAGLKLPAVPALSSTPLTASQSTPRQRPPRASAPADLGVTAAAPLDPPESPLDPVTWICAAGSAALATAALVKLRQRPHRAAHDLEMGLSPATSPRLPRCAEPAWSS